MTVLAITVRRRRPASHAFAIPVVRELPAQSAIFAADSAW